MITTSSPSCSRSFAGQREPVLLVEGVVVFAKQHRRCSLPHPLGPTLTHNPPHVQPYRVICAVYGPFPVTTAAPARAASASASPSESPRASAKQSAAANESPAP